MTRTSSPRFSLPTSFDAPRVSGNDAEYRERPRPEPPGWCGRCGGVDRQVSALGESAAPVAGASVPCVGPGSPKLWRRRPTAGGNAMDVVVVTGCGSGIGLQTALAFARRGDRVYAIVRDGRRCEQRRATVDAESLPVSIVAMDVTDGPGVDAVVADVMSAEDRIDVVVNNAGIADGVSAVEEIDESVARAVWETNFWGPFRLIRAVLPHMRSAGSGVIVNMSTFGVRFPGGPRLSMYGFSSRP
jgi:short chain dehydrogenase